VFHCCFPRCLRRFATKGLVVNIRINQVHKNFICSAPFVIILHPVYAIMKRGLLISVTGLGIVLANLLVGLIYPTYNVFNNILVSFSILSTTIMFYLIFSHQKVTTFPFALAMIFGLSGLTKLAFSVFSDDHWRNNMLVLLIMAITVVEATIIMLIYGFWKNRKKLNGNGK